MRKVFLKFLAVFPHNRKDLWWIFWFNPTLQKHGKCKLALRMNVSLSINVFSPECYVAGALCMLDWMLDSVNK